MSDDDGAVSIATLVITVAGRNDTPIAANDTASAAENGLSVSIDVLANDSDADQEDTPSTLNVDLIEPPAAASGATVTATGLPGAPIIYDPSSTVAFDSLGVGQTTTDVITYRAVDGHDAASNVATVRITITGVNDNPVATADAATITEDANVTISVLHAGGDGRRIGRREQRLLADKRVRRWNDPADRVS